jgi:hypothetical protein
MPLPSTSTVIGPQHIYPDRVLISFSYRTTNIIYPSVFNSILRQREFSSYPAVSRTFRDERFNTPVKVTAYFQRHRTPTAIFTAHLNALTDFHDQQADYGDEVTRAYLEPHHRGERELNWLHPDQVTDGIAEQLIAHLWERAMIVEAQIQDVAHSLVRGGPFDGCASLSSMKVCLVELCADFRTFDPHFCLQRIAPRFRERFNRVLGNQYGSSARGYTDLLGDANLIRGYRTKGEFYKGYEKTNRRLRLECTKTTDALSQYPSGRAIQDEGDFHTMFNDMRAGVAQEFNHVLRDEHPDFDSHGSVAEALSLINPILRRHEPAEVERVYQALIRYGRLTPAVLSGAALQRLQNAGLLENSARGIYVVAPRYRLAFRTSRIWDRRCCAAVRREAIPQSPAIASGPRRIVLLAPGPRNGQPLRRVVPLRPRVGTAP